MPYITQERRFALGIDPEATTPGELNYLLTRQCMRYLHSRGSVNYATLNAIVGALECAKQEFYRRLILPYENAKLAEHGDVYSE